MKVPYNSVFADHDPQVVADGQEVEPVALITLAVDEAMIEAADLHPPLRRRDCERLIKAALKAYHPAPSQEGHAAGPACSAPGNDDTAEVLFALEMALEHDERHQALALKTWIPRIRLWASAADRELARLTKSASRAPDEAAFKDKEQAGAWQAVCSALKEIDPDWIFRAKSGMDSAVLAIKELAAKAKTDAFTPDDALLAEAASESRWANHYARRVGLLEAALQNLVSAYSEKHSPQHRKACLVEAMAVLRRSAGKEKS